MPRIYIEPNGIINNKENQSHKFNIFKQEVKIEDDSNEDFSLKKNDISSKYPMPPSKSPISPISARKSCEFDGKNNIKKPN